MSVVPWDDIDDTPTTDIGDKIGVFKTAGATPEDQFKLLSLSQIRSTPENTHYVRSQEEVELALGPDLFIPEGTAKTVVIDQSFTITKPFKKQLGSSLLLKSESSNVVLTYTGTGALIQMASAVIGDRTICRDITLTGNNANECFALDDLAFVIIDFCILSEFAKVGFIQNTSVLWNGTVGFVNAGGLDFINCRAVSFSNSGGDNFGVGFPQTLFSFIAGDNVMTAIFQNVSYFGSNALQELLFVDPNLLPGSFLTVRDSGVTTTIDESLFQKGINVDITAVADNGNDKIRCTASSHDQINGTYAVLSGFPESSYNKTALITVINNDTFDVEEINFVVDSVGIINRASLDSRSPKISAESNPNQRDSMFIASAGLEIFDADDISSIAGGAFQIITNADWRFNKKERFIEGIMNTGQLICKDVSTREYSVKYSGTIEKAGGSSGNIGIILLKNGAEIAFNPPQTVNTGKIQISGDDLIELSEDDTIDIAVKNYEISAVTINTSQLSLVISKG